MIEPLTFHEKLKGKISTEAKCSVKTREELATAYTPGVALPCEEIAKNPELAYRYTIKSNTIAVLAISVRLQPCLLWRERLFFSKNLAE